MTRFRLQMSRALVVRQHLSRAVCTHHCDEPLEVLLASDAKGSQIDIPSFALDAP